MIRQGVVTQVVGLCGSSPAPLNDKNRDAVSRQYKPALTPSDKITWESFGEYLKEVDKLNLPSNVVHFVGHKPIREVVMGGEQRPASTNEIEEMKSHTSEAMQVGAFGLSSGLEFPPARSAEPKELKELASVVARYDGIYNTHMRNRDQFYELSTQEALQVARDTGVNLELSHLNAKTGHSKGAWFRVMDMVEYARNYEGIDVATECIPYKWGPGSYLAPLPDWLLADGIQEAKIKLQNEENRALLRTDCDRYWRFINKGEWDRVRLTSSESHPELVGKTFVEMSEELGEDPWNCYFDILVDEIEEVGQATGLHLLGKLFDESHVRNMISHPLFMLSSDATAVKNTGPLLDVANGLAEFSWVAKILGYYVRQEKLLKLEEAIRKMTSFPAQKFGLKNRGILKEGMKADVVLFNPETIQETGTLSYPNKYPIGIEYVFVNGELVVDQGRYNEGTAGKLLKH